MNPKSIVIVGPAFPLRGGLSTYNERLCRQLSIENTCNILTFSLQYPSFLFPGQTQFSTDLPPENLKIDVALNSVNPINWLHIGNKYKKIKPDLLVFRYWMPFMAPCLGTFARRVLSNGHTKAVAITDNIIPHEKRFFDKPFTRYFVNSMHGFVTMSKAVLQDLNQFDNQKPRKFVPHPMYDNFGASYSKKEACQKLGISDDCKYLLFFGFIRKYKGLDLLLQAMAEKETPDCKLIIAGEYYEDATPYKQLIRDLGIQDKVIEKTSFIPNSEVGLYFSACDMVVQTYHSATQSGVTQIAYHFDKPMLVTNVGGLAELVPNNKVGYVCERNPTDIATAIADFYENDRAPLFENNIKEEKKKFTWQKLQEAIFEVAGF